MLTPGGTITTFAGTGGAGYAGDGALATAALLNAPRGLAIDASGNVTIADTANNRVRQVANGTGVITTIAGNGQFGLAGDKHPATLGMLASPYGLAYDSAGTLYIADPGNQRIRAIDTRGIIRSVVGICGIVAAFTGDGGPADLAHVNVPLGLATDALGNLYIADTASNRVRVASIPHGTRGDSCPGSAGTRGARSANPGSLGQPPGVRIPQPGLASLIPMPTQLPAGTTVPTRPTRAVPTRPSTRVTAPGRQAPGALKPATVQAVPAVVSGTELAVTARPAASAEPLSPWYAALLAPLVLLVVALVIQWRRQRE